MKLQDAHTHPCVSIIVISGSLRLVLNICPIHAAARVHSRDFAMFDMAIIRPSALWLKRFVFQIRFGYAILYMKIRPNGS